MKTPPPPPPPLPLEPPPAPARPREKRRSSRRVLWIVLGSIAAAVGIVALMISVFKSMTKDVPVTARDKAVLVTAPDFVDWLDGFRVDATLERTTKTRNFDGSHELDYEYDADDLYVSCVVGVDRSVSDAKFSYAALTTGLSIGTSMSESELREQPGFMRWGDQSKCALIYASGSDEPSGNMFACRSGKRTFLLVFFGTWFDDAETFRDFLEPVLRRLDRYTP